MDASQLALVQGWADTRTTLGEWNRRPWPVLRSWLLGSAAVGAGLLGAVWLIATVSPPAPIPVSVGVGGWGDVARVLFHNSLVLALHALACVAGFIAGSSLPLQIEHRNGLRRAVLERAGPLAIAFVVGATLFSLSAQAYILGHGASNIASLMHITPGVLLLALTPHALAELTALFLPLAAWIAASRRGEWHKLLAATFVTVGVAVPILVMAAVIEVFVSPRLLALVAA